MTQKEFSKQFWLDNVDLLPYHRNNKSQNDYNADIRMRFTGYLCYSDLTEKQKQNYTLVKCNISKDVLYDVIHKLLTDIGR